MARITQVELNIGMNGHMYTEPEILEILKQENFTIHEPCHFTTLGKYIDEDEPTMVILTGIIASMSEIKDRLTRICDTLKQDCIAVLYDNYEGELIYNTRFPKGIKRLEFDPKYFIDAYDKTMLKAKNFK